jgi:hypothetical protein
MYKIEKNDLGFYLTFGGTMTKEELKKWCDDSAQALAAMQPPFGVIIDMRNLTPLAAEAQQVMVRGQSIYRGRGMHRSCVILDDAITTIQFMRLAKHSGIYRDERYIDASERKDWLEAARRWIQNGIDPGR